MVRDDEALASQHGSLPNAHQFFWGCLLENTLHTKLARYPMRVSRTTCACFIGGRRKCSTKVDALYPRIQYTKWLLTTYLNLTGKGLARGACSAAQQIIVSRR